ncbi:hypothetical protein OM076_16750 [Solirubrobacter ginsenosidimutans]|uniref:Uncharacterized protein n=1 Tax=Solirubrobacter ginsenosidimutans TaxID=490573 RepID=A0A9X3S3A8_9ACTN|nr:hypothetical protein [Solirubrobacter ginsenosidimutans]MDA0161926.1 hypothetical protein [Solirubrobacter ginsenosidimutans]
MTEHEQQADELQELSEQVGDDIAEAREDWERKKADDKVPGAQGAPRGESGSELPPPEPDETD